MARRREGDGAEQDMRDWMASSREGDDTELGSKRLQDRTSIRKGGLES